MLKQGLARKHMLVLLLAVKRMLEQGLAVNYTRERRLADESTSGNQLARVCLLEELQILALKFEHTNS